MKSTLPDFLTVGTAKFARTPALLTASLFHKGGTANGTYKVRKGGVLFLNAKGEPFAFLVANRWNERFFVSAFIYEGDEKTPKSVKGKLHYMHGLSDRDGVTLGVSGLGWIAEHNEADRIWNEVSANTLAVA